MGLALKDAFSAGLVGFFGADYKERFGDFMSKMSEGFKTRLSGVGTKISDKAKDLFDFFTDVAKLIAAAVGFVGFLEGFEKATKFFGANPDLGEKIASGLAGILAAFTGMGEEAQKEVAMALSGVFHSVWDIVEGLFGGIKDIIVGTFNGDSSKIWEGVQKIFDTIGDILMDPKKLAIVGAAVALKYSGWIFSTLLPWVGKMLVAAAPGAKAVAVQIATIAASSATAFMGFITKTAIPWLTSTLAAMSPLGLVALGAVAIAALVGGIWYAFKDDIIAWFKEMVTTVKTWIMSKFGFSEEDMTFEGMTALLNNQLVKFKNWLGGKLGFNEEELSFEGITTMIKNTVGRIENWFKEKFKGIADFFGIEIEETPALTQEQKKAMNDAEELRKLDYAESGVQESESRLRALSAHRTSLGNLNNPATRAIDKQIQDQAMLLQRQQNELEALREQLGVKGSSGTNVVQQSQSSNSTNFNASTKPDADLGSLILMNGGAIAPDW